MVYYIREVAFEDGEHFSRTAWSKARMDIDDICQEMGFTPLVVVTHEKERKSAHFHDRLIWHEKIRKDWGSLLKKPKRGDTVIIQIPVLDHSVLLSTEIGKAKKRGIRIVLLVHDLESIRNYFGGEKSWISVARLKLEEEEIIKIADKVIFHNRRMIDFMEKRGIQKSKTVELEIFDYLSKEIQNMNQKTIEDPVVIAGNLSEEKAGYVYSLPTNVQFQLYGINYHNKGQHNITYQGSFAPDRLVETIKGSFGLVWDGSSAETCEGVYGDYLRINNPHKTSLYLAAGMPVIIWEEAALAEFVKNHNVGICIHSLDDIKKKMEEMTLEEYSLLVKNSNEISIKIRNGYYTKKALNKSL